MNSAYAKAVKTLWSGRCDVFILENVKDEMSGRTKQREARLYENEPCRITYDSVSTTEQTQGAAKRVQTVTLHIDKSVNIPAGSRISVTQNGVTELYKQSGVPAVYSVHQEIPLELFGGWA